MQKLILWVGYTDQPGTLNKLTAQNRSTPKTLISLIVLKVLVGSQFLSQQKCSDTITCTNNINVLLSFCAQHIILLLESEVHSKTNLLRNKKYKENYSI